MRYFFFGFLLLITLVILVLWPAGGQSQNRNPLGVPIQEQGSLSNTQKQVETGKPLAEKGAFERLWAWVKITQGSLFQDLRKAVLDVQKNGGWAASFSLILVSFTYGMIHAVGPGHGKVVISSYVLANERVVKRGILLSFVSAFFQAVTAITVVVIMTLILNVLKEQVVKLERFLESASYAMIALIGLWLLVGQLRKIFSRKEGHSHIHDHHHHEECGCGHSHVPDAKSLEDDHFSLQKAAALVFAIGIRPCSGALIILTFCFISGLYITGILSVFAMALGTAISVSVLAIFAVGSKQLALKFAGAEGRLYHSLSLSAGLLGSSILILIGILFFMGSISAERLF